MGVLDYPAFLFSALDVAIQGILPGLARVVVWALLSAILSMGLYWVISPQERLAEVKRLSAQTQKILLDYDGDFSGLWPRIGRHLRHTSAAVGLTLGPAIVASLPILCVIIWLDNVYGYTSPKVKEPVTVRVYPVDVTVKWLPRQTVKKQSRSVWSIQWPPPQRPIKLYDSQQRLLVKLPFKGSAAVLEKRYWWNRLIGNPIGYLPLATPVNQLTFDFRRQEILRIGPSWMRGWELSYFLALVIASIMIKLVFRIR